MPVNFEGTERWTAEDEAVLWSFLHGATGRKLLLNMKFSVALAVMDSEQMSEWDDGKRAGLADSIMGIEALATDPNEAKKRQSEILQMEKEEAAAEQELEEMVANF